MKSIIRRIIFKLVNNRVFNFKMYYFKILGMNIGDNVNFKNTIKATWPHKVSIGNNCTFENNVYFKHDGIYSEEKSIIIGSNCFFGEI